MADSSRQLPHQEQHLHDSEYTSDSNDEFASASEGDDDLPWEPVVIRSPMVFRQSPQPGESTASTPRPSHANVGSDRTQEQQGQQEEHPTQVPQQQEYQYAMQSPPQQHQQQQQQQHQWQALSSETNQTTSSSLPASRTTSSQNSLPQSNQHESFSTTTTRVQTISTATRSRSTPKLRERVRQSPVLHSRIVRAYLDPNASSAQQHTSLEFVREAWLQEHQEDQRESSEEEEEENNVHYPLPDQQVPSLTPLQSYHSPAPVLTAAPVAPLDSLPLMNAARTELVEADDSWGFDDTLDIGESAPEIQEESSRTLDEYLVAPDDVPTTQSSIVVPDIRHSENSTTSMIHQDFELDLEDEDAWGGDDQLMDLVEADIQSTVAPNPVLHEEVQHVDQSDGNQQQYDYAHISAQEHEPVNEYEQEPGSQLLHQTDTYVDEMGRADRNLLIDPEDDLQLGQDHAADLQESLVNESYPSAHLQPEDTTSMELSRPLNSEAAWQEGEVSERPSAHEALYATAVEESPEKDAQTEPNVTSRYDSLEAFAQDGQIKEETSMGSDAEEAEASWGFDMDPVIDIEACPIEEAPYHETGLHHDTSHSADDVGRHNSQDQEAAQVDTPQFPPEARESLQINLGAIIPKQVMNQTAQGSDDENDSEVREVMHAAQHNPLVASGDCLQTGQSSMALSSIISDSQSAVDNEDGRTSDAAAERIPSHGETPYLDNAPVVSHLSIMQDTIPEPIESTSLNTTYEQQGFSSVAQDLENVASDSEGSDIYGDLSTARSGINASSNRLNEILDDDDYLEHMERGVPMNRSISTPYSDDESPKFIVEDEIVELMERGEPRGLASTSLEHHDDLDDNSDSTSPAALHLRSPSPAPASSEELNNPLAAIVHGDGVEFCDPEIQTLEEFPTAITAEDAAVQRLETSAPASTPVDIFETTSCTEVSKSAEEPFMAPLVRKEMHTIEAKAVEGSDDQDPANPFSDAAAVAVESDSWPVTVQPIGKQPLDQGDDIDHEDEDEAPSSVHEIANQGSWLESSLVEDHLDVDVQEDDAWAEQDLNIVVEPVPPVSLPSHMEISPLTASEVISPETLVISDPSDQPSLETDGPIEPTFGTEMGVEEHYDGDAWGDDADQLMDDIASAVQPESDAMPEAIHTLMETNTSAYHDVQIDDHVDEFQKHYSPLLPAEATDDQVSERAWSGSPNVHAVADVEEENDAWLGNDEINVLETTPYSPQTDRTEAPSLSEGSKELSVAQEPVSAVDTPVSDAIHDAQLISSFGGNISADHCSETVELGDIIDEALVEGDAWGDQDEHIVADFTPADAGVSKAEGESELVAEVYGSDQQPDISTTHANIEHSNIVDNWNEEDAWNDEDIDLMDASSLVPKQEVLSPGAVGNRAEDIIDAHVAEPTTTMTFGAPNIADHSMDTTLDHDAWIDQDLKIGVTRDDGTGATVIQKLSLIEAAQLPSDIPETRTDTVQVEISNVIHSDLREDLWSDHDLDLEVRDSDISGRDPCTTGTDDNEEHQETGDHVRTVSSADNFKPFTEASEKIYLKFTQSAVDDAPEPTSALGSAQLVDNSLLDDALDADAWGDQDIHIETELAVDDFIPPHAVQPAHGDKVQDECLDVKNETRPSSITRVGSIIIHQTASDQSDDVVEDAWGWDEDEVGVHLEIEKETPPPSTEETMALADDTNAGSSTEQGMDDQTYSHHGLADAKAQSTSESITSTLQRTAHSLLPAHGATDSADRLSPLAIHKEGVISGTDSGEGDEDSTNASQSPWQDVSPASVSKRSEAGMSVGSEFESEYSIQSLEDDEHASSSQAETKTPVENSMSWTSLHTDGWQSDSHGSSGDAHGEDKSDQPAPSIEPEHTVSQPALEIQDLPDISGADSWDFDQDDNEDLQSDLMAVKQELSPLTRKTESARDLKTPDMDEHPLFTQQTGIKGSFPTSPNQPQTPSTPSVAAATANEVEDDSHLPLAIRQQRARLAAKGKPLPPISKYNSVKDTGAAADHTLSPRLSAATSPVAAFASPAKSPLSPMLKATSPSTPAASSSLISTAHLSPALQKQRERLEQKRAAAAAAAATPLSAARRMTVTETPKVLGSQLVGKPTSPLLSSKTLSSALKSTLGSPTLAKKTVQLVGPSEPVSASSPLASPTSLGEDSAQLSSRRRGSSAAPMPSSPLAEGFVRRSRDGSRPNIKPATGFASDTAVRTSQSDSHRRGSWLTSSSAQSGWDETFDDDEFQDQTERDSGFKMSTNTAAKDQNEPPMFSSASSSSFYQQSVPGLDDNDIYGPKASKTTTTTTITTSTPPASTSSYLSSKKADDYDPYWPVARKSGKSRSSVEDTAGSTVADYSNEILIGGSTMSSKTNVSLLSPTSVTTMSHRHDHHHGQHSSTTSGGGGGGFFSGGSNSLVGDISTILGEKAAISQSHSGGSGSYEDNHKKPPSSLQKSSSWSFGSWVSSAVAVASEKIDKAYESLDPEYSRMKTRGGSTAMDDGSPDPESSSPFKKPGYVVGGSSLALGLASISKGPSAGSSQAPPPHQHQHQQQHHTSPPATMTPTGLGFGSGGHGGGGAGYAASDSRAPQQQESHAPEQRMPDWERGQATTPRLTRKNVSGR
ncbi:hypothetical protein EC968_000513 [Mortierella alpina]|nr:hypothetical protein EC968_000513 [Mortierella alpina]